ncbi:unnamed protein product [Symbiodinium necroappetens]|uniref:Uncharacterized protein n=1 Tax=Symbiodinium necroappetens TaxID=1628268 RepID=A0A813AA69_9DINO|nr:unnamed protein product [Symbiodinium necroappetens]
MASAQLPQQRHVGLLLLALALANGDGPPVTTTTTTTKDPYIGGCNPFNASYNLFAITAARPIQASCFSAWRLHEVELFSPTDFALYPVYYHIPSKPFVGAISAVRDGDLNTSANLGSDVGVGCTCWNSDKIGSTGLMVIKQREPVARIKLTQGGDSIYSVSRMKIQCGNRYAHPSYFEHVYDYSPMFVDTSSTSTTITCNASGCLLSHETPVNETEYCPGAASAGVSHAGLSNDVSVLLLTCQLVQWLLLRDQWGRGV